MGSTNRTIAYDTVFLGDLAVNTGLEIIDRVARDNLDRQFVVNVDELRDAGADCKHGHGVFHVVADVVKTALRNNNPDSDAHIDDFSNDL